MSRLKRMSEEDYIELKKQYEEVDKEYQAIREKEPWLKGKYLGMSIQTRNFSIATVKVYHMSFLVSGGKILQRNSLKNIIVSVQDGHVKSRNEKTRMFNR